MYYHVSKTYLGEKFTFLPRIPGSGVIAEEGNIPRICVSTSIYDCLRSITCTNPVSIKAVLLEAAATVRETFEHQQLKKFILSGTEIPYPSVYYTVEQPYIPPNASDFRLNKEHWFLEPVEMSLYGYIDLKWLCENETIRIVSKPGTLPPTYLEMGKAVIKSKKHTK